MSVMREILLHGGLDDAFEVDLSSASAVVSPASPHPPTRMAEHTDARAGAIRRRIAQCRVAASG